MIVLPESAAPPAGPIVLPEQLPRSGAGMTDAPAMAGLVLTISAAGWLLLRRRR
jgi:LPXTG-motif cell wall-anchored protein